MATLRGTTLFPQKMTIWVCELNSFGYQLCVWMSVNVQHVPAMAVVGQPAGPARRPGGGLSANYCPGSYPQYVHRISYWKIYHWSRFQLQMTSLWPMFNSSYLQIDDWSLFEKAMNIIWLVVQFVLHSTNDQFSTWK